MLDRVLFSDISEEIFSKFQTYHYDNIHVYELFKKFSLEVKSVQPFYGAKAIMERIRWEMDMSTVGDRFKINNNYTSFYARLLASESSEFEHFFKTRSRK